jgi:hypothetical protein
VRPGYETSMNYFLCSGGSDADSTKPHWDTLRQTCVFGSGAIFGPHNAFCCFQGMKRRCTIFHAPEGPVQFPQKARQDTISQTCILHQMQSISVRPGRETSTHNFSCSGEPATVSTKCTLGHVTPNLCLCIRCNLQVT